MCNALVKSTGEVLWVPPAIYKSSCTIGLCSRPGSHICRRGIFPLRRAALPSHLWKLDGGKEDKSNAVLQYDRREIKLDFEHSDRVDLSEYAPSSIWDLIDAPAMLIEDRSRIDFQIRIRWGRVSGFQGFFFRRKTLFYTVVLIIPTISLLFLNITAFYLPTASGAFQLPGSQSYVSLLSFVTQQNLQARRWV